MSSPRLVVVHNNIDQKSSIGKLATFAVRAALGGGYRVLAVAKDLDPELRSEVEHIPLHVPPAVFAYQWARAPGTVKRALKGVPYELLHTYQPQLTGLADTWQSSYLTRTALQTGSFPRGRDALTTWRRLQVLLVATMEDRYLRNLPESVNVLFPSVLMRDEFQRLYGLPPRHQMLPNPAPDVVSLSTVERQRARDRLVGSFEGISVGYLGGTDERKGWQIIVDAIAATPNTFLLFGGSGSAGFLDTRIADRCLPMGYVDDVTNFFAACDVLAVPSRFDPFAMVVTEAAAHGIPSITTSMVGVQKEAVRFRATLPWDGLASSFAAVVNALSQQKAELAAGAVRMAEALSERHVAEQLRTIWAEARVNRGRRHSLPPH